MPRDTPPPEPGSDGFEEFQAEAVRTMMRDAHQISMRWRAAGFPWEGIASCFLTSFALVSFDAMRLDLETVICTAEACLRELLDEAAAQGEHPLSSPGGET